ncbi:hypothetical protein IQ17_01371 [Bradyrhizobium daqingense]|uniref:Uncharacterized protein n=1 Tax=Bradyrhizobium daqingense TaxID=993502 RepID=A0A562LLQ9_9BRAD|nr:hypothetical protein IQ17_01371 [Bradyrhizobium daqingense]
MAITVTVTGAGTVAIGAGTAGVGTAAITGKLAKSADWMGIAAGGPRCFSKA